MPAYFNSIPVLAFFALLSSCQPYNPTHTHNTPHFTKGNQLEASLSLGMFKGNGTLAYTPVKYVALQVNGYGYELNGYRTRYAEVAAGVYLPFKELVIGLNGGYGLGAADWQLRTIFGYSGYTVNRAIYDIRNIYAQAYLSVRGNEGKFYWGPSLKINSVTHDFYLRHTDAGNLRPDRFKEGFNNVELTVFLKRRLAKWLYFNINGGISIPNSNPYSLRIGLTFKL